MCREQGQGPVWLRHCAFELWYWRILLRVPWTAGRSNQSILKEISPGISLEGMMLKLKLQDFGHLMRRVDSLEKKEPQVEYSGLPFPHSGDLPHSEIELVPPGS